MMKRFLILVASLVLVMSVCMTSALAYETMYVKTGNGKTLNVRSEPATGDNVLLRFPYGHQVTVNYHLGNGWTCIMLAGAYDVGYVQTKFLVSKDPGKYVPSSADAELAKPATSMESYTLEQLNEVLKTARSVTPLYRDPVSDPQQRLGLSAVGSEPELQLCDDLRRRPAGAGDRRAEELVPGAGRGRKGRIRLHQLRAVRHGGNGSE